MLTFVFAGLFGFLYIYLTINTIKLRRKLGIPYGTSDSEELARASGAHSNFAQYTPFVLLLSFFCEAIGTNKDVIFGLLLTFFIGRILHFYSVTKNEVKNKTVKFRVIGMVITITTISILSTILILGSL